MMNSDAKISFGIDSILKSKKVSYSFFSLDLGPKVGFWGNWKWRKYFKGRKFFKFRNIRSRRNGTRRKTWIEPTSTTSNCCPTQSNQSTLSKVYFVKMMHSNDFGSLKKIILVVKWIGIRIRPSFWVSIWMDIQILHFNRIWLNADSISPSSSISSKVGCYGP